MTLSSRAGYEEPGNEQALVPGTVGKVSAVRCLHPLLRRCDMPTATATRRRKPTSRAGKRHGTIRVGTASWSDPGFIADWYPSDLPAKQRLPWYAEHFDLVEVNSTFYAVPSQETVARWSAETPRDFKFDVKLHRLLSRHSTPSKLLP